MLIIRNRPNTDIEDRIKLYLWEWNLVSDEFSHRSLGLFTCAHCEKSKDSLNELDTIEIHDEETAHCLNSIQVCSDCSNELWKVLEGAKKAYESLQDSKPEDE